MKQLTKGPSLHFSIFSYITYWCFPLTVKSEMMIFVSINKQLGNPQVDWENHRTKRSAKPYIENVNFLFESSTLKAVSL